MNSFKNDQGKLWNVNLHSSTNIPF